MNQIFLGSMLPLYKEQNTKYKSQDAFGISQFTIPEWIKYLNDLFDFFLNLKKNGEKKRKIIT